MSEKIPRVECQDELRLSESIDGSVLVIPESPDTEWLRISYVNPGTEKLPNSVFKLSLVQPIEKIMQPAGDNYVFLNGYGEAIDLDPERTAAWALRSVLRTSKEKQHEVFRLIGDRLLEAGERGEPLEDFSLVVNTVYPHEGAPTGTLFGLDALNVVGYRTYIVFTGKGAVGKVSAFRGYGAITPEEIYKSLSGLPKEARTALFSMIRD